MIATAKAPVCEICAGSLIEAPRGFVVCGEYVTCGECFREGMKREIPEEMERWEETRPYVALPEEIVKAAESLKTVTNTRDKEKIESWLLTAVQRNSSLPHLYSALLTSPILPSLGAFMPDKSADPWECLRCKSKISGYSKRCEACGYRELSLYGQKTVVNIYWQCDNCKFPFNCVSRSQCLMCKVENPELAQSPNPSVIEEMFQAVRKLF